MKTDLTAVILMVVLASKFFVMGLMARQDTIESRTLKMEQKECYTWQDIEIIVFGEIQQ